MIDYRGFTIEPKRDFGPSGFYIGGRFVKRGYVVVKERCNAMPAATWFLTIEDAKQAIDVLIDVDGADIWKRPASYSDKFWECLAARRAESRS